MNWMKRSAMTKHRPNDLCWCGSGTKFKRCHRGREDERPLHPAAIQSSVRQQFSKKTCLHPEAALGVCNQFIDAHTVQRANTLQALIDSDNHVLSFHPFTPDINDLPKVQRVGWRRASTFTGFCGRHDAKTFEPVEQGVFNSTPETAFLLTYRALCHELFQKQSSERARCSLQSLIDRGASPERQRDIQHDFSVGIAGVRKAIDDLLAVKRLADMELLARDYTKWHFVCLTFSGALSFAVCGAPTPNQNLSRAPLQTLHDPNVPLQHLYISVVAVGGSPYVVLGWRKEHAAPRLFVDSLLAAPRRHISAYFVQYVFAHLENVYFSAEWWNSLTSIDQERIRLLARNSNAYYFPPDYAEAPSVPWHLVEIQYFNE